MNRREIIERTIQFNHPERVAQTFPDDPDLVLTGPELKSEVGEWRKINAREWRRVDEWGNVWGRVDDTSKGEVVKGALEDLSQVETFALPDFSNPAFYATVKAVFDANPERWRVSCIQGATFSLARKIRRMDQYLMDILLAPEQIRILHDRIDEQIIIQIEKLKELGADSIMIVEDWGTQDRMLIHPRMWREEFKPRFEKIIRTAHDLGMSVFMHSCGKMTDIIPDLVECGLEVLQFDQPRVHGLEKLASFQEHGKITFWCPVDIQTTLQTKDENLIRQDAREMLALLWKGEGGFIAGYYSDNPSLGLEPKWQAIACEEFKKQGKRAAVSGGL